MANTKSRLESPFHGSSVVKGSLHTLKSSPRSRLFEEIILKSWWTILFFLLCYFAYDQAVLHKTREENKLREKLQVLEREKTQALAKQEDLKLQIASQEDESFIELTLMRRLGLVPEGQIKVHFIQMPP